ncbi:flagellar protein FlaG [Gammaproteobacteria bacterium]
MTTIEMTSQYGTVGPPDIPSAVKLQRGKTPENSNNSKGADEVRGLESRRTISLFDSDKKDQTGKDKESEDKQSGKISDTQLKKAVRSLNDYVQTVQRNLEFTIDKDTGQRVIKVVDTSSKEVIRQIPPEEVLTLAKRLGEAETRLFSAKA